MRMASTCYSCILERGKFEADLAICDEVKKKEAMEELVDYMASNKGGVPALVGTERERIIQRISGCPDPYRDLKAESNLVAARLIPAAREFYQRAGDKLEALVRIAAAANSMEFGVKGHEFDNSSFDKVFEETLAENLDGDLARAEEYLDRFDRIYYLTDNCGEVVFDLLVIEKLQEMGKEVVVGPKAVPILNDVTAEELQALTRNRFVPTGDVVGLSLERSSQEAQDLLRDENWLIIAKGMGNFETMTEFDHILQGRLIYILRAKCDPVASKLGVPRGTLVVRTV